MKLVAKVKFLSRESKCSAKGNNYIVSTFMQEGSADVLMCMDKSLLPLSFGEQIDGVFEYNPKYQKMEFVGVSA